VLPALLLNFIEAGKELAQVLSHVLSSNGKRAGPVTPFVWGVPGPTLGVDLELLAPEGLEDTRERRDIHHGVALSHALASLLDERHPIVGGRVRRFLIRLADVRREPDRLLVLALPDERPQG